MNRTILVFKTSVRHHLHVRQLQPTLDQLVEGSGSWSFDLNDCDRVLRIERAKKSAASIVTHLRIHGFHCEELPD